MNKAKSINDKASIILSILIILFFKVANIFLNNKFDVGAEIISSEYWSVLTTYLRTINQIVPEWFPKKNKYDMLS